MTAQGKHVSSNMPGSYFVNAHVQCPVSVLDTGFDFSRSYRGLTPTASAAHARRRGHWGLQVGVAYCGGQVGDADVQGARLWGMVLGHRRLGLYWLVRSVQLHQVPASGVQRAGSLQGAACQGARADWMSSLGVHGVAALWRHVGTRGVIRVTRTAQEDVMVAVVQAVMVVVVVMPDWTVWLSVLVAVGEHLIVVVWTLRGRVADVVVVIVVAVAGGGHGVVLGGLGRWVFLMSADEGGAAGQQDDEDDDGQGQNGADAAADGDRDMPGGGGGVHAFTVWRSRVVPVHDHTHLQEDSRS